VFGCGAKPPHRVTAVEHGCSSQPSMRSRNRQVTQNMWWVGGGIAQRVTAHPIGVRTHLPSDILDQQPRRNSRHRASHLAKLTTQRFQLQSKEMKGVDSTSVAVGTCVLWNVRVNGG
jgi:hypothetical protein